MGFVINKNNVENGKVSFLYEEEALTGVKRIADKVRKDVSLVFDATPSDVHINGAASLTGLKESGKLPEYPVIFGTLGHSPLIDELSSRGLISTDAIKGKREVYSFTVIDEPFENVSAALVIAGSDKRGTIYGLFRLSDILNVSPLVDWCDVMPCKKTETVLSKADDHISKEPSVKYRGFFINDEWPAFGNWAEKNFGGFNAKMYEHVFELLLRLKGNYLWPAMWSAVFPEDGPGLENAELADELGVIMGMSHHEPCLRQGEEYKHLRGPESVYGDAWDFRSNKEGIIRFWEDGLKRGGRFKNVITVGMRGEFDSKIMGEDATLKDNIDLLRDVLKTQNRLIKENVNADIDKVPRMLALYKEVEPFFYGDEDTEGLKDDPELEGVTLMLCDDNFGNLRTLPTVKMRDHKGGYGMYYHFDYHGWPVSYEWINSSNLPKVWEQMTTAYEFGIRELWIVNVGDIFTNEYPLSYFLDLAYDYDKWGVLNPLSPDEYTEMFVEKQFGDSLDKEDKSAIEGLLKGYTKILSLRRPEAMNDKVFDPVNYCELEDVSTAITELMETADTVSARLNETNAFTFFQLVGYPLVGTMNLIKMWLACTENHWFADIRASFANKLADEVRTYLKLDKVLAGELDRIHDGKWYGMGLSEHVGFNNWNEEECAYPVIYDLEPSNKDRIIVTIPGTDQHTEGGVWTGKQLTLPDFLDPSCVSARITLYTTGSKEAAYKIINDKPWLSFSPLSGTCPGGFFEQIFVKLDRESVGDDESAYITINTEYGDTKIFIPVNRNDYKDLPADTYVWLGRKDAENAGFKPYDNISIEAIHYAALYKTDAGEFKELSGYGRGLGAMKAFPVDAYFNPGKDAPGIDYRVFVPVEDEYEADLYLSPSNPVSMDNKIQYAISVSYGDRAGSSEPDEEPEVINVIPEGYKVGDDQMFWAKGVLDNIRISTGRILLSKGLNTIRIYAVTPGFVLQKIVIREADSVLPASYLGPAETYRTAM